jgi:hypothetical protein
MATPNKFGVLGPLIRPEHYITKDDRIATSFERFCLFIIKYLDEHPQANWILPDDEMTTPH